MQDNRKRLSCIPLAFSPKNGTINLRNYSGFLTPPPPPVAAPPPLSCTKFRSGEGVAAKPLGEG